MRVRKPLARSRNFEIAPANLQDDLNDAADRAAREFEFATEVDAINFQACVRNSLFGCAQDNPPLAPRQTRQRSCIECALIGVGAGALLARGGQTLLLATGALLVLGPERIQRVRDRVREGITDVVRD